MKPERVTVRDLYAVLKQTVPPGFRTMAAEVIEEYCRSTPYFNALNAESGLIDLLKDVCLWDNFQIFKMLPTIRARNQYVDFLHWKKKLTEQTKI